MADMIMQYRVMPADGEIEYNELEKFVEDTVKSYDENLKVLEIGPRDVGFGLKACIVKIQFDENLGSEELEDKLKSNEDLVGDVIVELMDRL
jgi:translation elongation factor EF-1beta